MSISRRKCLKTNEDTEVLVEMYNYTTYKNYTRDAN
jgi:hypothetical protein